MEMCTIDEFTNKQFIALVRSKSEGDRNKTKLLRTRPEKVIQPLRKFAVKKYGTAIFLDNKIFAQNSPCTKIYVVVIRKRFRKKILLFFLLD